jgi:hypothetical protein
MDPAAYYRRLDRFQWVGMHLHASNPPRQQQVQQQQNSTHPVYFIMLIGMGLLFPGTLIAYALYVIAGYGHVDYTGHWPSVTTMLGDWPLVGSITFGAGMSLVATSVMICSSMLSASNCGGADGTVQWISYSSAAVIVTIWGVVGSSAVNPAGVAWHIHPSVGLLPGIHVRLHYGAS